MFSTNTSGEQTNRLERLVGTLRLQCTDIHCPNESNFKIVDLDSEHPIKKTNKNDTEVKKMSHPVAGWVSSGKTTDSMLKLSWQIIAKT